jgi:hypothetical protein
MPHKMTWYIEKQVVLVQMWGEVTTADYSNYFRDCNLMFDQSERPMVHLVVDTSRVISNPNLLEIKRAMPKVPHPREGWIISVVDSDTNILSRFVVNAVSSVANKRVRQFNGIEAALAFLHDMDSTIDWDQARPEVLAFVAEA